MGNCLGSQVQVDDESHNNPTSIFVNPTTSSLYPECHCSSADQSQVSNTASGVAILNGEILPTPNLKKYSYAELKSATRGFKPDSILGDGGLALIGMSEVNFLGRLSHPNLVRLLGYCWDDKELLLVYEFVPKGSLDNHLFRRNVDIEPLSWMSDLK
ncbi:hypothetical protein Leryth_021888 [Lithospermum erythrorhizon]|nr:hypothetical protein Leryth_021888 [Lithospermum erythrorhizon]